MGGMGRGMFEGRVCVILARAGLSRLPSWQYVAGNDLLRDYSWQHPTIPSCLALSPPLSS